MAAPVIQSATVKNTKFMLSFDSELDAKAVGATTDFSLLVDGEAVAVHHFKVKGDAVKLFVHGNDKIAGGAVVTLSYTDPTAEDDLAALQGSDGTDVESFVDFAVTNQGKVKPVKGTKDTMSKTAPADDAPDAGFLAVIGVPETDFLV